MKTFNQLDNIKERIKITDEIIDNLAKQRKLLQEQIKDIKKYLSEAPHDCKLESDGFCDCVAEEDYE